jgi:hypothetical protein
MVLIAYLTHNPIKHLLPEIVALLVQSTVLPVQPLVVYRPRPMLAMKMQMEAH